MSKNKLISKDGIKVHLHTTAIPYLEGIDFLVDRLDQEKGIFLSSGIEYPDRYSRWEIGFINPPLELIARNREVTCRALNQRGEVLLKLIAPFLVKDEHCVIQKQSATECIIAVNPSDQFYSEEERSKQPTVLTIVRNLVETFQSAFKDEDDEIIPSVAGVFGALAYDLIFQFDPIQFYQKRSNDKLFHLFFPDQIYALDRRKEIAERIDLDFAHGKLSTVGIERSVSSLKKTYSDKPATGTIKTEPSDDHYRSNVEKARERMRIGDIFEVVLRREFSTEFKGKPSDLFKKFRKINPSPYEFIYQLGDEALIGTSPEMFVRVDGKRVESCPISGTVRRTGSPMEDSDALRQLLNSEKDEVELTMCTDVDRNDKSRICAPGSVKLLARRQIEAYAGLYHTVDHMEGMLRDEFSAIDAFLSHMWAVTLTGAPKKWAVQIIEELESSPRRWYGGAIGGFMLNGNLNTGITIRTIHLKDDKAFYNVGATLVYDSTPEAEEQETRTKASAFFKLFSAESGAKDTEVFTPKQFTGMNIIMIDNEDSFVHTLADYLRQTGANVKTFRSGLDPQFIIDQKPDLVVHSPGPGWPEQFKVPQTIRALYAANVPQFGVCLGLQGTVEAFGGKLKLMDEPRHGKTWQISHQGKDLFAGIQNPATVGAYHSIIGDESCLPQELEVIARNENDLMMALRHKTAPIYAVQFHPESIMTLKDHTGRKLIQNLLGLIKK